MEKKLTARMETVGDLKTAHDAFTSNGFDDTDKLCPRNDESPQIVVVWVKQPIE